MNLTFHRARPEDPMAAALIEELSAALAAITGDSGKSSFSNADMADSKSVFLIAKTGGSPVACGALRRMDEHTCELKRMYAKAKEAGIGSQLLAELEREAARFGYSRIRLETRKVNQRAVNFYLKHHYVVVPNFGKYVGNDAAVCFEKKIEANPAQEPMDRLGKMTLKHDRKNETAPEPAIKLLPASSADFDRLAALRIAAMRESLERVGRFNPERARERLRRTFSPEHTRIIVFEGKTVGFYTLRPSPEGLRLDHLYVHPDFQSRGIGGQVLKKIFEEADRTPAPILVGALKESASNRFYLRHGFGPTSESEWDIYYIRPASGSGKESIQISGADDLPGPTSSECSAKK